MVAVQKVKDSGKKQAGLFRLEKPPPNRKEDCADYTGTCPGEIHKGLDNKDRKHETNSTRPKEEASKQDPVAMNLVGDVKVRSPPSPPMAASAMPLEM